MVMFRDISGRECGLLASLVASSVIALVILAVHLGQQCAASYAKPSQVATEEDLLTYPEVSLLVLHIVGNWYQTWDKLDFALSSPLAGLGVSMGNPQMNQIRSNATLVGRVHSGNTELAVHMLPLPLKFGSEGARVLPSTSCRTCRLSFTPHDCPEWRSCDPSSGSDFFMMVDPVAMCKAYGVPLYPDTFPNPSWPNNYTQYRTKAMAGMFMDLGPAFYVIPFSKDVPDVVTRLQAWASSTSSFDTDYGRWVEAHYPQGTWVEVYSLRSGLLQLSAVTQHCIETCSGSEQQLISATFSGGYPIYGAPSPQTGVHITAALKRKTVTHVVQMKWYNAVSQWVSYALMAKTTILFLFPSTVSVLMHFRWSKKSRHYCQVLEGQGPALEAELMPEVTNG